MPSNECRLGMLCSPLFLEPDSLLGHQNGLELSHLHIYVHSGNHRHQEGEAQHDAVHQVIFLLLLGQEDSEVDDNDLLW